MRDLARIASGCLIAIAIAAMGCGDGSAQGAAEGGAGGPSSASITGSLVDLHVTEGGDIEQPVDPALVSVAALLPEEGGGFTSIAGSVGEDGRFSIPDVPEGTYYLEIGRAHV